MGNREEPAVPAPHEKRFQVRAGEAGSAGRLRSTALCHRLQEAAGNQAPVREADGRVVVRAETRLPGAGR
jgi:hypothetical protein